MNKNPTKPTDKEIQKEIETLKKMKPTVRMTSIFGDNHHHAIDAQIRVLEKQMTEYDIDDAVSPDSDDFNFACDNVRNAMYEAARWLEGESENGCLSDEWESLVIKGAQ